MQSSSQNCDLSELNRMFTKAAGQTRVMVQQKVLSPSELNELNGLFQQGTVGDGNMWKILRNPKFMVDTSVKARAEAWGANRGKNSVQAKEEYVTLVENLTQKYCVIFPPSRAASVLSVATTYTTLSNN